MRIIFIGDVMARAGRDALQTHLPTLKAALKPDFIVVNGDNAAHGRGITGIICKEFYDLGVDCITSGDHVWDQREIITYIGNDKNLIRPLNYPAATPGAGIWTGSKNGKQLTVMHLQGRVFMDEQDSPFDAASAMVQKHKMGNGQAILVDFHAEASSEKMGMAHYLDGKVSAVIGTHTHMPTADHQIFPKGTAFQGDAGMTGDYNSVIGARSEDALHRFIRRMPQNLNPADGEATLCGCFIQTNDNGLATSIEPIRLGGRLSQAMPIG